MVVIIIKFTRKINKRKLEPVGFLLLTQRLEILGTHKLFK